MVPDDLQRALGGERGAKAGAGGTGAAYERTFGHGDGGMALAVTGALSP